MPNATKEKPKSREGKRNPNYKHGMRAGGKTDSVYKKWRNMFERCRTKPSYIRRGIRVCPEWKDFKVFHKWSVMNGYNKSLQLDREDNDGNYEPNNCRFVTAKVNANNKCDTIYKVVDGVKKPLSEWCREYGINNGVVHRRLRSGWPIKKALTKPVGKGRKRK